MVEKVVEDVSSMGPCAIYLLTTLLHQLGHHVLHPGNMHTLITIYYTKSVVLLPVYNCALLHTKFAKTVFIYNT